MGQAKRRGTFEQRKTEATRRYLVDPVTKQTTELQPSVAVVDDGPFIPLRRPRPMLGMAAMIALAGALGPWPTERTKFRNAR